MRTHTLGSNKWQTLTEAFDRKTKKKAEKMVLPFSSLITY